jgi:hypothetical protein
MLRGYVQANIHVHTTRRVMCGICINNNEEGVSKLIQKLRESTQKSFNVRAGATTTQSLGLTS